VEVCIERRLMAGKRPSTENRALYTKIGYVELNRRTERPYSRLYEESA